METIQKWDLSHLFTGKQHLQNTKEDIKQKAISFEERFKDKLASLDAEGFEQAIKEYESILELIAKVMTYAYLQFASDTTQGAIYSECELEMNANMEHLLFFDIEFGHLPSATSQSFMEHATHYSNYLNNILKNKKHLRSTQEENIILKLSPTGANAFERLFSEHFSRLHFKMDKKQYTEEEILSKLHDPQESKRKKAAKALTKTLKREQALLTYIFNIIKKEWAIKQDIRQYSTPEESRHIANQTTQKSVDSMLCVANENMYIVADFYNIKKKLLNKKKLYDYDRYAPLFESKKTFDIETSASLVLESFKEFCPLFAEIAQRALKEQWIDSHPRAHKQSGAFSHPAVPSAHPYVLLNHTNNRRDLFTMAHELGHAIHQELSKKMGYLNADTPLTTSETASVFAEMLLFEKIKNTLSGKEKIALYASKLEDIFATLFRQTVFTNFERKIHAQVGEISTETISNIWFEENQKMFGESVILTSDYKLWWSYIPHFIHSPFYCYAYSYGQLLVMALFGLYRQEKNTFIEKYITFLSAGGSRPPKELVALFGFDIESKDFWTIGINEIKILMQEFKESIKKDY